MNRSDVETAQNGFTLIEVLIVVVILSIGILGVAKMQMFALSGHTGTKGKSAVSSCVQQKAERLMALGYTDSNLADTTVSGTYTNYGPDTTTCPGLSVTWSVDTDSPASGVKTIQVTATNSQTNQTRTLSLIKANCTGC